MNLLPLHFLTAKTFPFFAYGHFIELSSDIAVTGQLNMPLIFVSPVISE